MATKRNIATLFAQKFLSNPDGINMAEMMIEGAIQSALAEKDAEGLEGLFDLRKGVRALKEKA